MVYDHLNVLFITTPANIGWPDRGQPLPDMRHLFYQKHIFINVLTSHQLLFALVIGPKYKARKFIKK